MPQLSCCVDSCTHNKENCCCKNTIKVGGKKAEKPSSTCCESFHEQDGSFTNSIETPNAALDVKCDATNCIHNCNCSCAADSIDVSGVSACSCDQTQCSSFQER
ncbi:protein of unknown function [Clostridium collagenovorans DSM 3089]|uniref:DUF1540 domain-containing protein n=1 Tax=Clostridium collagenovorans DSM 3089 TaxID=1121306 RepID=A0A1M5WUM2_9CLOT|nr:DUF1540 domain-containing protein [Clostridium collagenovorans]SHH91297.1 protein of unknown function [Clostridium collagenovorans DSM 3089]